MSPFTDEEIEYLRGKMTSSKLQNEWAIEVMLLLENTNKDSGNDLSGNFNYHRDITGKEVK